MVEGYGIGPMAVPSGYGYGVGLWRRAMVYDNG